MIRMEVKEGSLKEIERKLGNLDKKGPGILKKAINDTAKSAMKDLKKGIRDEYIVKVKAVNEHITLKGKAAVARPEIQIIAKSEQMELFDFQVSPNRYTTKNRPKTLKGRQKRSSGLKELKSGNIKAFVVEFKNGHKTAAQRQQSGSERSSLGNRYIKKLLGSSMPYMAKPVWEKMETNVREMLRRNIDQQIKQVQEE